MWRLLLIVPFSLLIASDHPSAITSAPAHRNVQTGSAEKPLPTPSQFAELAKTDPLECMRASLRKYRGEVHGLHGLMKKQERIRKRINESETIEFWFRDEPHSVLLSWRTKPAGLADRVLYVDGSNDNQLLVHPATAIARAVAGAVVTRDPEGREAKAGGRVSIVEFGLKKALERNLATCEDQKKAGKLKVEYLGLKKIPEVKDRSVHMFRRINDPPEGAEQAVRVEFGLDEENWMQTVSWVYNGAGDLLGSYFFLDLTTNPKFDKDQFDKAQLAK